MSHSTVGAVHHNCDRARSDAKATLPTKASKRFPVNTNPITVLMDSVWTIASSSPPPSYTIWNMPRPFGVYTGLGRLDCLEEGMEGRWGLWRKQQNFASLTASFSMIIDGRHAWS